MLYRMYEHVDGLCTDERRCWCGADKRAIRTLKEIQLWLAGLGSFPEFFKDEEGGARRKAAPLDGEGDFTFGRNRSACGKVYETRIDCRRGRLAAASLEGVDFKT